MKKLGLLFLFFALFFMTSTVCYAIKEYKIEINYKNEFFIIDGKKFTAHNSYCYGMDEGDTVIFTKGGPDTYCYTAEIINLRTKKDCKLNCLD